jgi:hypothetical protein
LDALTKQTIRLSQCWHVAQRSEYVSGSGEGTGSCAIAQGESAAGLTQERVGLLRKVAESFPALGCVMVKADSLKMVAGHLLQQRLTTDQSVSVQRRQRSDCVCEVDGVL